MRELEKKDEQRQLEFENEVKRLATDKKRAQETVVKKTLEVENLKLRVDQSQADIEKAKQQLRQEHEVEIAELRLENGELIRQLNEARLAEMAARADSKQMKEKYEDRELQQIEATGLEKVLADKVADLRLLVEEYSLNILNVDKGSKLRLQEKERLVERLHRELSDLQHRKNSSCSNILSQSELRRTISKYNSSQTLTAQLKTSNSILAKQKTQLEGRLTETARKLELMVCKYAALGNENRSLKQQILDLEKQHIAELHRKNEETDKMKRTIGDIGERLEKCLRGQEHRDAQAEGTLQHRHLTHEVQELTGRLAQAHGTIDSQRNGERVKEVWDVAR